MNRFRLDALRIGKRRGNIPENAEFLDELHLPSFMGIHKGYEATFLQKTQDLEFFLYKIRDIDEKFGRKRAFYVKAHKKLPKKFLVIKAGGGVTISMYGYLPIFEKWGGCSAERGSVSYIVP